MRVFAAALKMNLKLIIQYRWTHLVSLIADPVILLIHIALFTSVFKYNKTEKILGYSLSQMIWYFASITLVWYFIWNSTDINISGKVLSGSLTVDLLKPLSIMKFELANAIASRIVGIALEAIPSIVIYSLIFYPDFLTVISLLKFLSVVSISFVLYFLINFLLGLLSFVMKSNASIYGIKMFIISLTAGAIIPLEFFPGWMNRIIFVLPFQYLFYWPIQFFLNRGDVANFDGYLKVIGFQMFWCLSLYGLCKLAWSRAMKKFCAVGG